MMVYLLLCGGIFVIVTLAAGIGLLLYSANTRKKAEGSAQWPSVPGTITTSEVKESSSTDEDGQISFTYTPHIEYTYDVAGQTYTGKKVSFGAVLGHGNAGPAQTAAARYPVQAPVQVFYNPANPADSVLERTPGGGNNATRIIGIVLIVISILSACPLLIMSLTTISNS
jgi:hypothetical protein